AKRRSWRGMGMFLGHQTRHDDPSQQRVHEYFRNNLEEIVRIGRQAGVKIILSTVASNLKDCAPFASLHGTHLAESQRSAWDQLYLQGQALESAGRFPEAVDKYSQAAELDREFAELQYRLGSCYLALTNLEQARRAFELARDFDALPFRADSRVNEVIRKVASRYADQGVSPLDAVGALSADSRIPGQESFYEHVHLNFDGTYRLARALAEQVAGLLPPTVTNAVKREWASADLCGRRLALTDWNRHRVYEMVLNRVSDAPFTNQSNFLSRQTALGEQMNRLQQRMNAATLKDTRA